MFDFRPRSNAELLDAAFELYRRHFAVFFTIAVIGFVPLLVVQLLLLPTMMPTAGVATPTVPPLIGVIIAALGALLAIFIDAAIIAAAAEAYLGRPTDVGSAFATAFARPGALILATLLKWLAVMIGFVLFFVPGIFMFIRYFAVPATVVLEDHSATAGMHRSHELARGNRGRIFVLLFGALVFYVIAVAIIEGIFLAIFHSIIANAILATVIRAVVYPFIPALTTLLYYDIRIRQEGYDVELMASSLGTPAAPASAAAV